MAFINKLFPSRHRKNPLHNASHVCQCPTNSCDKLFSFAVEQIQIVLFKECDFRGRKLLFDSDAVEKQQLDNQTMQIISEKSGQQPFVEISKGFGYRITKPRYDLVQLREMVFGSVSMAYRGTMYKIHSLDLPPRLVFSQVFPSPRIRTEEYQSGCSYTFCNDHLSTASDTLLICRRQPNEDIPIRSSLISSSGYGGEQSHSLHSSQSSNFSVTSGPPSVSVDLNVSHGRISTSSIPENPSFGSSQRSLPASLSLDDHTRFRHKRPSKLGLAIILQLPNDQENEFEIFLMQHIAIIESILWKVRQGVESAYVYHKTFYFIMFNVYETTAKWFVDFISAKSHRSGLWMQLSQCDIPNRIQFDCKKHLSTPMETSSSWNALGFRNFARKWLKPSPAISTSSSCEHLQSFIQELCELIDAVDVKQTNFFLSTLITGMLTHHLGWVVTVLSEEEIQCERSENLLVRQTNELYGCLGFPSKISHTIIVGNNQQVELIQKLLTVASYFIRCGKLQCLYNECGDYQKSQDVSTEFRNCFVLKSASIPLISKPPENSKLESSSVTEAIKPEAFQLVTSSRDPETKEKTLKKSRTCFNDLDDLIKHSENIEKDTHFEEHQLESAANESPVIFVLGDNDKLEKLKESASSVELEASEGAKPKRILKEEVPQSQTGKKSRYVGVKFNFQQHPQIFANYMKSKNIELAEMHLQDKKDFEYPGKINDLFQSVACTADAEDMDEVEPLQTPSNASEMEYTSELVLERTGSIQAKETIETDSKIHEFTRCILPNTLIIPEGKTLKLLELPMPEYSSFPANNPKDPSRVHFMPSLLRTKCTNNQTYLPFMALQGVIDTDSEWLTEVKKDLILASKHPGSGQIVDEAVAIVANVDKWDVKLISSHSYVIEKNANGIPVGTSQLVANMLETLLQMWKLHSPPEFCLMHIEQKLGEFCVQSKAVAQLLLETEFCSMEYLTSTLKLDPNDVPLLLAVASIHSPKVTQKYGLRFQ